MRVNLSRAAWIRRPTLLLFYPSRLNGTMNVAVIVFPFTWRVSNGGNDAVR